MKTGSLAENGNSTPQQSQINEGKQTLVKNYFIKKKSLQKVIQSDTYYKKRSDLEGQIYFEKNVSRIP